MKHLRKFNEGEDYYKKLSVDEVMIDDSIRGKSIPFSQREVKLLEDFCSINGLKNGIFNDNRFDILDKRTTLHDVGVVKSGKYGVANRSLFIMVRKYDDDWYTVFLEGKYEQYKCDQIEGVIKLLEDLFNI
jgi:hypothetical protein